MAGHAPVPLNRRDFLARVAAAGAGAAMLPVLAACGGEETGAAGEREAPVVDASACAGYNAVAPEQARMRQSFGYVDATPAPDSNCANCRFYTRPAGGSACGACQLFHGPVSPGGWCRSWAPAPAT